MPDIKLEKALVLSRRRLGENTWLISLFTQHNGRFLGVCKKKTPPEIASFVEGRWQARLSEQLGSFYLEPAGSFSAAFLDDKKRLAVLGSLCALLDTVLPERQNYESFYHETMAFLESLESETFLSCYVRWEMGLLKAIGFGLDCTSCAGGGDSNDLAYISPKTGRAVSREKGAPYHNKLLSLPSFLWKETTADTDDIRQGLLLTGYFLSTYTPLKQLPKIREQLF
ncbi:MAG: DNA repair protein RecO [Alphaproteobacteria bacterium]